MLSLRQELYEFLEVARSANVEQGMEHKVATVAKEFSDVVFSIYQGLDSVDRERDLPAFKAEVTACISQAATVFLASNPAASYIVSLVSGPIAEGLVTGAAMYSGTAETFYKDEVVPRLRVARDFLDKMIEVGEGAK